MNLFDKAKIGNVTLQNRFLKASSWEALATKEGHLTPALFDIHKELAEGGAGAILTGYASDTKEEKPNPGMIGIYNDSFIPELKKLTTLVHEKGSKIFLQIAYGGSFSNLKPPSKIIYGPSAVPSQITKITPIEMTKENIEEIVEAFAKASKRAKEAGFDGVELHGAHGYLLSSFLTPYYNQRTDEYGGSIENRARIIIEILKAAKKSTGENFPILIKLNSADYMEKDGLTFNESIIVAKMLEKAGIDAIEVSGGNENIKSVGKQNLGPARRNLKAEDESYFQDYAKELVKILKIPVILTGGNRDFKKLEALHKNYGIDFFGISRPMIREPNLINLWKKDPTKPVLCISCNGCFRTIGKRCVFNKPLNPKEEFKTIAK